MIVKAALVPSPPLLAQGLTGRADVLPELREACAAAIGRLLSAPADVVAIVGAAPVTATWDPGEGLDGAWASGYARGYGGSPPREAAARGYGGSPPREAAARGYGGSSPREAAARGYAVRPPGKVRLPLALGIGAQLLDEARYAGPRALESIDAAAAVSECALAGARVAGLAPRVALLVVGDGSARRTPAAPGYFDERAEAFDASAETAIRDGDMAALAGLDAGLAAELMATGRAAWQVLAGAAGPERRATGEVLYSDAPFGVAYLVAVLDVR